MSQTPLKSIRSHCLWCCADQSKEVELCTATGCPVHAFRFGRLPGKGSSSLKAIRGRCLDCVQGPGEVAKCGTASCDLHPFRTGKNPNYTEETRQARRDRVVFLAQKPRTTGDISKQNPSEGGLHG